MTDAKVFEDVSLNKEFSEFQKSFEELLKKSKIDKLVILIDDLDRCLPKVTIETLEAARLFMFTKYTAFVIAADEAMMNMLFTVIFPICQQIMIIVMIIQSVTLKSLFKFHLKFLLLEK